MMVNLGDDFDEPRRRTKPKAPAKVPHGSFFLNGCPSGKRCYPVRSQAKNVASQMPGKLSDYRCRKCGEFHVGHRRQKPETDGSGFADQSNTA